MKINKSPISELIDFMEKGSTLEEVLKFAHKLERRYTKLNRFEVIDETSWGRSYVKYWFKEFEYSWQDGNKTLKILLK